MSLLVPARFVCEVMLFRIRLELVKDLIQAIFEFAVGNGSVIVDIESRHEFVNLIRRESLDFVVCHLRFVLFQLIELYLLAIIMTYSRPRTFMPLSTSQYNQSAPQLSAQQGESKLQTNVRDDDDVEEDSQCQFILATPENSLSRETIGLRMISQYRTSRPNHANRGPLKDLI